jgi:hypothetical protein
MMPASHLATSSPPEARSDERDQPGGDLDGTDQVHGILRRAGQDVVELGGQVLGPVAGEHLGELVEARTGSARR